MGRQHGQAARLVVHAPSFDDHDRRDAIVSPYRVAHSTALARREALTGRDHSSLAITP